jgi:glycerol uptake facilitator-like aquaporin
MDTSYLVGTILEGFMTFTLCTYVSCLSDPEFYQYQVKEAAMAVASFVILQGFLIGQYTGGLINPSIGIGLSVGNAWLHGAHQLLNIPMYTLGPFIGSFLAYISYKGFFKTILSAKNQINTHPLKLHRILNGK